jgi:hypothetical protein
MTHLSMTYCDSVFGLGLVPLPLALCDDPPTVPWTKDL